MNSVNQPMTTIPGFDRPRVKHKKKGNPRALSWLLVGVRQGVVVEPDEEAEVVLVLGVHAAVPPDGHALPADLLNEGQSAAHVQGKLVQVVYQHALEDPRGRGAAHPSEGHGRCDDQRVGKH